MDVNHNGMMSLAEVDKGLRDVLQCNSLFDAKPVIIRAFMAAKDISSLGGKHKDDYIEREEFKVMMIYLRRFFEYFVMFTRLDRSGDGRLSLKEFIHAMKTGQLQEYGV